MSSSTFLRQLDFLNPEDIKQWEITIIGAGGGGSTIAFTLAKMGIQNMNVYDFDTIEEHNVSNQMYSPKHVGKPKVEALKEVLDYLMPVSNLKIFNERVTKKTDLNPHPFNIIVFACDNYKTRKELFEMLKGTGVKIVDARMGGEMINILTADTCDSDSIKKYEKTLHKDPKTNPLPCTGRSIIYNLFYVSAMTAEIIKRIIKNEPYVKYLLWDFKTRTKVENKKK